MKLNYILTCAASILLIKNTIANHLYSFRKEPIDVVIPAIEKDLLTLDLCIDGIRKNGSEIRNIYVISPKALTNKAIWFDEKEFPFSFFDIANAIFGDEKMATNYLERHDNRIGWIYQQLLKFYAFLVIPNISSNILLLDADTIFLNPVTFINELGEPYFNTGTEYHPPYFVHAKKLLSDFRKVFPEYSGICHHMLVQKCVLEELFACIQSYHHAEPWRAFCHCIESDSSGTIPKSCMSEYEIYFNYIFSKTKQAHLRLLNWLDVDSLENRDQFKKDNYHYLSCHAWMRARKASDL